MPAKRYALRTKGSAQGARKLWIDEDEATGQAALQGPTGSLAWADSLAVLLEDLGLAMQDLESARRVSGEFERVEAPSAPPFPAARRGQRSG
jgi:hypothetical protein